MKLKTTCTILLLTFLAVAACRTTVSTQKPEEKTDRPVTLPRKVIPAHHNDSLLVLPKAELLPVPVFDRKAVTLTFGSADKEDIKVRDPKLFAEGSDEIIYLSRIKDDHVAFPLKGAKVISPYAGRRRYHSGVDLKTGPNDTIVAAFDGVVRMAKPYAAYGNLIVVRHFNGLETVYSHNSKNLVKPGVTVKAGQPVALTGSTGRASTAHLHFEARINGVHFNPDLLFDFTTHTLRTKNLLCSKKNGTIIVRTTEELPHQMMSGYAYHDPVIFLAAF